METLRTLLFWMAVSMVVIETVVLLVEQGIERYVITATQRPGPT